MRRSRKPFGLYKVTRVRIPPPPPFWLRKLPAMGAFLLSGYVHANTAEEEGFEPARARSVKKTRHWRVFSAARSAQADRINFELRSKFGHPSYPTHTLIAFDPSPKSKTCTSPSKDVKNYRLWRLTYMLWTLGIPATPRPHSVPTAYRGMGPLWPASMYYVRALSKPATQRTSSCPSSPL